MPWTQELAVAGVQRAVCPMVEKAGNRSAIKKMHRQGVTAMGCLLSQMLYHDCVLIARLLIMHSRSRIVVSAQQDERITEGGSVNTWRCGRVKVSLTLSTFRSNRYPGRVRQEREVVAMN